MNLNTRWLMVMSVLFLVFISMTQPVTSQKIERNNTMIRWFCSMYKGMNDQVFLENLNSTLSSLRKQLSRVNTYHVVAKTVINGESVYGQAWCREHLSTAACLSCYDTAVSFLKVCGAGNGAHAFYDDCDLRYENKNFYNDALMDINIAVCGNTTSSQPKEQKKATTGLLSDLQTATPSTPTFFAASTRNITGSNVTVYAIAQCGRNISKSICSKCLKIRSRSLQNCLPSTSGKAIDTGCFMRYSEIPFFEVNQTTDITRFLFEGYSRKLRSIYGGVFGGIGILLLIIAFFFWHHQSKKSKHPNQDNSTGATDLLQMTMVYTYKDLKAATNNFSDKNIIGGGCDRLYKGVMMDKHTIAIKKIVLASKKGKTFLDSEIQIIGNVHHRHLIRLLGYCRKGPHMYLVLEYMENGSLDNFLYGDKRGYLNWQQRFDIIYGTARGLAYLHEQYHVTIIHRDIKPSNILLDDEFQPKISDFGLVKLLPEDKSHLSSKVSSKVTGTLSNGYMAPEYAIKGHYSEKVDIYSFGVIILEIISGKCCNDLLQNESLSLIDHARSLYDSEEHLNLMDVTLDPSEYKTEDIKKIIEIALSCTDTTDSERPSMSDVVILLSEHSSEVKRPVRSTIDEYDMIIQVDGF